MAWKYNQIITLGYTADGKRVQKRVHGNSKSELADCIYQLKKEFAENNHPSEISFKRYSDRWLETYKSKKSINTQQMYEYTLKKFESIDPIRIRDVKNSDLQLIINDNWDMPRTCQNIRLVARQIFKHAIEDGIISSSPAASLELPKNVKEERRALTQEERQACKSVKLKPMDRMYLDVLFSFGLRPGEASALTFDDFTDEGLVVNKAIAFDGNNPVVKPTKTEITRIMPISDDFREKVKKYQSESKNTANLFHTRDGRLLTKIAQRRMWERITDALSKELKAECTLTQYNMRHDYATRLYYIQGISFKKKAQLLGHSEKMLMEIYSHLEEQNEDLSALDKINEI